MLKAESQRKIWIQVTIFFFYIPEIIEKYVDPTEKPGNCFELLL